MKHSFLILLSIICLTLQAQIQVTSLNHGLYQYNSGYQYSALVFYLYGDGYYNFEHDNTHHFLPYANGNIALAYTKNPYDNDDPVEEELHIITGEPTFTAQPTYPLQNKVAIETSWNLVQNGTNYYILQFENKESQSPISGCIEFHYNSRDTQIDSSQIKDDYGNYWVYDKIRRASTHLEFDSVLVWNFDDLDFNEQRFVYIPAECLQRPMEDVSTRAVMKVDSCNSFIDPYENPDGNIDGVNDSNTFTHIARPRNFPHDPNGITTDPQCLPYNNPIDKYNTVRYKIHFQNDGDGVAPFVELLFKMDAPYTSIKLVDASDYCTLQWDPQQADIPNAEAISVFFDDIMLPGINQNPPPLYENTYGWVEFDVCFNENILEQYGYQCSNSYVDIIFENQPPEPAYNKICNDNCSLIDANYAMAITQYICPFDPGTDQVFKPQNIGGSGTGNTNTSHPFSAQNNKTDIVVAFPNPTHTEFTLQGLDTDSHSQVKLYSANGALILDIPIFGSTDFIDISNYANGVYLISITNETISETLQIIKY